MFPHFSYLLSAATLFPSPNEPIIISTVHISITFHLHVYTPNFQIPIIHHLFSAHVYHHTHSSFTYPSHYPYNSPLSLHFPYLFYQPLTNPFPLSSTMPSLSNHHTHFLPTCMEPCTRTLHTTHTHPSCISIAFILVPFSIPTFHNRIMSMHATTFSLSTPHHSPTLFQVPLKSIILTHAWSCTAMHDHLHTRTTYPHAHAYLNPPLQPLLPPYPHAHQYPSPIMLLMISTPSYASTLMHGVSALWLWIEMHDSGHSIAKMMISFRYI